MPQAGWCRECGEWVWVDEEGACQHGHGPECVGGIYDATPQEQPAAPDAGFGVGEMPDNLYRFSWAAFTLPFFWGIAYGAWPIVMWWLVSMTLPFLLAALLGTGAADQVSMLVAVTVVAETVSGMVRLWAGTSGHSILWRKEALRLEVLPGAAPRFSVTRFKSRQRTWTVAGWVLLISALVASVIVNFIQWEKFGLSIPAAAMPLVFMGAEVWLGVWLSLKMRDERPGVPGSAEEPAEHSA